MDILIAVAEPIHILLSGGTLQEAAATEGAWLVVAGIAFLIPATVIGLGIDPFDWRDTPFARVLGFRPTNEDSSWMDRAADLDGDGRPDF